MSIIFVSCEEKDCYRDFSIEQVGFGSRSILRAFSIFESGSITKHLMTGSSGNSEFCFPSTSMFLSGSPRKKQNSLFPLWPVIKCLVTTKKWHTMRQLNVSSMQPRSHGPFSRGRKRTLGTRLSLMLLPHFDVFCNLSLSRRTATWNLLVLRAH